MGTVRQPAVAGTFYPADPRVLAPMILDFLDAARADVRPDAPAPKAIVAPHAGYVYSGSTAALAYARAERRRDEVSRVVLLGPCHRVYTRGLATPGARTFRTPLGDVPISAAADDLPGVERRPDVHRDEHSLEVHVPFLQTVLGDFELVPLAVGDAEPALTADVLEALWGGPETLIVVSTDLSHYLPYDDARETDAATIDQVLSLGVPIDHRRACGASPLNGLLEACRRRGLRPELLGACNSGDTAGDLRRVVGYASFEVAEPRHEEQEAARPAEEAS